jgi:uncharacterized protein (DUF433 family)
VLYLLPLLLGLPWVYDIPMKRTGEVKHPHIERAPGRVGGEPVIRGTRFSVRAVVEYVYHQGMLPEEMVREWNHLTLAEIHDALSYYHDNRKLIGAFIRRNREAAIPKNLGR